MGGGVANGRLTPDHPNQPGVGGGHDLPAHGPRIPLPGADHGLAQPVRGGLFVESRRKQLTTHGLVC